MEKKLVRVPFEVDLAKRIQNGEVDGKIVTRHGLSVRIICWDVKHEKFPLGALVCDSHKEGFISYTIQGKYYSNETLKHNYDLMLGIPEYMTFKDGDIIAFGNTKGNLSVGIFKKQVGAASHECYAMLSKHGILTFDVKPLTYNNARFATEDEKQKLVDTLKASNEAEAKDCLKILGIEQKQEYEFKPFDRVLVRDGNDDIWQANIFSHKEKDVEYPYRCINGGYHECIPYNDQTAHLIGTTDNWEE